MMSGAAGGGPTRDVDERALVTATPDYFLPVNFSDNYSAAWLTTNSGLTTDPAQQDEAADTLLVGRRQAYLRFWPQFLSAVNTENERGIFFLMLPIVAGSGAVAYFSAGSEPEWLALISGLTLLGTLRVLARRQFVASACLTLGIAFLLGMLAGKVETERLATQMMGSDVSTRVTGRVVSMETLIKGGWRVTLDVLSTERPVLRHMPERLRVTARDLPALTEVGSGLTGLVRLRAQSGPVRPGNYDFAFNSYFRGVGGNGFFLGTPALVSVAQPTGLSAILAQRIAAMRQAIGERITDSISGEEGAVASALISGQRAGISEETNEALRQAGLAHVLSISGLHLALAAGVIMLAIRAAAALFPSFSARHPVKKYAAVASLLSSAFYLAMSGADVAAQRSFIMISVMLLALLADRAAISMRNLAIATLVTIVIAPHEILGPSFQMSFSATAALIAAFAWWSERKGNKRQQTELSHFKSRGWFMKLIAPMGATAMTSLVAGTASGIFAAYHFNNTAPFGLLGNVLALPVISIMIMPFAVMSLLLMPLQLEWLPLQVMGAGVSVVRVIAEFVASLSPEGNPGLVPISAVLLWTAGLIIAALCTTRLRMLSLLFVVGGLVLYVRESGPDIIISEDAKLVAVRLSGGRLAVNHNRPSRFIIENWQKAYRSETIVKPVMLNQKWGATAESDGFTCEEGVCTTVLETGHILAYTNKPEAATTACNIGDIVILAIPGKTLTCDSKNVKLITQRDLALKGSLEIRLGVNISADPAAGFTQNSLPTEPAHIQVKLSYAVEAPERPWHLYRIFSRAARGVGNRTSFSQPMTD